MTDAGRLDVRGLKGDPAHDGYTLRTVGGVPMWLPGVPPGGAAGQILTKASGTDYDANWANPATGGGTGALRLGAKLGSNFTSSTNDADVAITGVSISFTPLVNGVLSVWGRWHASKTVGGRFAAWVLISPSPSSGDAIIGWQDSNTAESGIGGFSANIRRTVDVADTISLSGGTAYTISSHFTQGGGGSATFYASSGLGAGSTLTAIGGLFVPA